jgi:hypothetical protein
MNAHFDDQLEFQSGPHVVTNDEWLILTTHKENWLEDKSVEGVRGDSSKDHGLKHRNMLFMIYPIGRWVKNCCY